MSDLHCVPAYFFPDSHLPSRMKVLDGVWIQSASTPLGKLVRERDATHPMPRSYRVTHLIVVDTAEYLRGLKVRVEDEGGQFVDPSSIDTAGIAIQVAVSLALTSSTYFAFRGSFGFRHRKVSGRDSYIADGTRVIEECRVPERIWSFGLLGSASEKFNTKKLRQVAKTIDRYYRSGTFSVDRVSMALGHYFEALLARSSVYSFVGLSMALESLFSTTTSEIAHTLAERTALVVPASNVSRTDRYLTIKRLYNTRSKLVHGASHTRKGPLTYNSLSVSAKMQMVPVNDLGEMGVLVGQALLAVLRNQTLLDLFQQPGSAKKVDERINSYFIDQLMKGA